MAIINQKSEDIEKLRKEKEELMKEARKKNMLTDQELRANI